MTWYETDFKLIRAVHILMTILYKSFNSSYRQQNEQEKNNNNSDTQTVQKWYNIGYTAET